jgi:hypothetical protein
LLKKMVSGWPKIPCTGGAAANPARALARDVVGLPVVRAYWSLSIFLLALCLAVGCDRDQVPTHNAGGNRVKTYTDPELKSLITLGMTSQEVTNVFGPPGSAIPIESGVFMWTYMFPLQAEDAALHLSGFTIYLKDSKVIKWSPVMGESQQSNKTADSQAPSGRKPFQIFLATDDLTNIANVLDISGSADASALERPPDLAFEAQLFLGKNGNGSPGMQTIRLVLSEQDAAKLKSLTEDNFGKRLLVVYQKNVIAAPLISAPITSRQVTFAIKTNFNAISRN